MDVVERVCERIEAGEPLAAICKGADMPGVRTFLDWADRSERVAAAYTNARNAQAEHLDAEIDRIAKTATDKDSAAAARVQINALIWRASKQAPKKYGERVDLHVDHKVDLASIIEARRQRVLEGSNQISIAYGGDDREGR